MEVLSGKWKCFMLWHLLGLSDNTGQLNLRPDSSFEILRDNILKNKGGKDKQQEGKV